jgi:hypothetical protein
MVQYCDPWLLITKNRAGLLRRLFGKTSPATHKCLLQIIHSAMEANPRFGPSRAFTRSE